VEWWLRLINPFHHYDKLKMKIVAIGGGGIKRAGARKDFYPIYTEEIDREIIRLTGKKSPRVLFLPTAKEDSLEFCKTFIKYFGKRLGCDIDVLYLIKKKISKLEIRKRILDSDMVYVGGGNTMKMLEVWRKLGVDKILKEAGDRGIVLSGVSAGAICWFKYGISDSLRYVDPKNRKLMKLPALGFIDFTVSPHYNTEKERQKFLDETLNEGEIALALEDCTAIEIIDDKFRIITSKKGARIYRIYMGDGRIIKNEINFSDKFISLNSLNLNL
jgi:dipeptidase E